MLGFLFLVDSWLAMMNNRARYPPGIGAGRGVNAGPAFQSRTPQPQYVQRGQLGQPTQYQQNHHQQQQHQQQQHQQHQHQQHQQWLRRTQLGSADSTVDEVEKTVQSVADDSRCIILAAMHMCLCVLFLCGQCVRGD